MAIRTRTLFLGSGPFALPALASLAASDRVGLVAVVTAPERPSGRRAELRPTPVGAAASRLDVPVLSPSSLRHPATLAALRELDPDLIVLADYGRLVPAALLDLPAHGALNLHPSLLPRHRGATPVAAAILAGDRQTGVTLMRMDEGLDTGPIVAQVALLLDGHEVAPELESRLADLAATLLTESLPGWLEGILGAVPQPAEGATLTRPLRRQDGLLDAMRPAAELERQVRAYQPWPGSFLDRDAERLIVWQATVVAEGVGGDFEGASPGALVPLASGVALVTSSGWLGLDEVQPAGGGRMSGAAYLHGRQRLS